MESIGKECTELKREYDQCFNVWFAEKFLKGDHRSSMCDKIFTLYQNCVRDAIKRQNIDLLQLDKDVLGSNDEQKPPPNSQQENQQQQNKTS
ncbi:TP53-regulated inhibitor of apoptosis 1 [Dermatophagoides farinae]|uniref:TP53-regulated inhibitor of apoptosis 1 n=1 Tax=Dermatophagoides farinae TaxID=6954 RepID=A0A922LBG9_DERFA|nr:TP53-regulated inhibitor of apoptosis 1-like [Dermatophagoides farinae]KAH7639362.1 tp53-regulated inhibitor of apoptosis 1-b-like [Dermatophagoides farinae]KAH9522040.1 TP53-regulated inhibitor of apoptosis 1 [Dermatophagoides farinae]